MYLNKIKIQNFRNYEEQTIDLNKDINIFYGYNAQGKTNILESVFLCAFGKSFRTNKNESGYSTSKYGFSNFELKDYSELQELERCLKYEGFKGEKVRNNI